MYVKKHRWFVFVLIIALMLLVMPMTVFAAVSATLYGFSCNYPGSGKIQMSWQNSNLGNAWAEGENVPYQFVISGLRSEYGSTNTLENMPEIVIKYQFYSANADCRFVDLVKGFQVKATTDVLSSKQLSDFMLQNSDQGWPHVHSLPNAPIGLADYQELEDAQNYNSNLQTEFFDTSWKYVNVPGTQINLGTPSNYNPATHTYDTWAPLQPANKSDQNAYLRITDEQLIAAYGDSIKTADTIIIYFQLHLSRTSLWQSGLYHGYANPAHPAYNWGGWVFATPAFNGYTSKGSSYAPGSSGDARLALYGQGERTVSIPVPKQPLASVSGYKWKDADGDHIDDGVAAGEGPLEGWPIYISAEIDDMAFFLKTTTDANGFYTFPSLTYGIRYITEGALPGWLETTPWSGSPLDEFDTTVPFGPTSIGSFASYEAYLNDADMIKPAGVTDYVELAHYGYMVELKTNFGNTDPSLYTKTGLNFGNMQPDAYISIAQSATNQVNDEHEFIVMAWMDIGSGWEPVNDGTLITFHIDSGPGYFTTPNPVGTVGGIAKVKLNSDTTGMTTVSASANIDVGDGLILTRTTDGQGDNTGPAQKTWVDAKISIAPSTATNAVGTPHILTATVMVDYGDGAGWVAAPNGTVVNFTTNFGTLSAPSATTTDGAAQVTLSSPDPGVSTINASATVTVGGVLFKLSTNGTAPNSGPAQKTWVNAKISITPATATNAVGTPHILTATVMVDYGDGAGWVAAPNGTVVNFTTNFGTLSAPSATTTDGAAQVTLSSPNPGVSTINATATVTVGGVIFNLSTNGTAPNSGPAQKTWVNAKISITPATATNAVGTPHILTATVMVDYGDGAGWVAAPNGTVVNFTTNFGTLSAPSATTTGGSAQVTLSSPNTGVSTINATATVTVGGVVFNLSTNGVAPNSGHAHKTWVNAKISISPATATNAVGTPHILTATVMVDYGDGEGWVAAPNGTVVNFTTSFGTLSAPSATTTGGAAQVTLTSALTGVSTINATATVTVGGVIFNLSTNGVAPNSGPATKTWVNAKISIAPATATNAVGTPHILTATVMVDYGNGEGWVAAPNGTVVNFTTNFGTLSAPSSTTTGGNAQITLTSANPGVSTINATATVTVGGVIFNLSTNGVAPNSGPATKTWVNAKISISPPTGTNMIGTPHPLTATVWIDYGDGNGFILAPDGTKITFAIVSGPGYLPTPAEGFTSGGTGSVTINLNSNMVGTTVVSASTTVNVGGAIMTRTTDGVAPNSGPAIKNWISPPDETAWAANGTVPGQLPFNPDTGNWATYLAYSRGYCSTAHLKIMSAEEKQSSQW